MALPEIGDRARDRNGVLWECAKHNTRDRWCIGALPLSRLVDGVEHDRDAMVEAISIALMSSEYMRQKTLKQWRGGLPCWFMESEWGVMEQISQNSLEKKDWPTIAARLRALACLCGDDGEGQAYALRPMESPVGQVWGIVRLDPSLAFDRCLRKFARVGPTPHPDAFSLDLIEALIQYMKEVSHARS